MFRVAAGSLCLALLLAGRAAAAENPQITQLKNQVKGLKKEQDLTVKAIQARYKAIKRRDRLTQQELRFERDEIRRQEEVALALAASALERQQVRAAYDQMRAYLSAGIRLDQREIQLL